MREPNSDFYAAYGQKNSIDLRNPYIYEGAIAAEEKTFETHDQPERKRREFM